MTKMITLLLMLLAATLCGCIEDRPTVPSPPDMSHVHLVYPVHLELGQVGSGDVDTGSGGN